MRLPPPARPDPDEQPAHASTRSAAIVAAAGRRRANSMAAPGQKDTIIALWRRPRELPRPVTRAGSA